MPGSAGGWNQHPDDLVQQTAEVDPSVFTLRGVFNRTKIKSSGHDSPFVLLNDGGEFKTFLIADP